MKNISALRIDYKKRELNESEVKLDAIEQFRDWLDEAIEAEIQEANAMTLSTVDSKGQPRGRIVLLKGCDDKGFVFFTNYDSSKGKDLEKNPKASLTFFWPELERQIRIEGEVIKLPKNESDDYFNSRPLESRIGAISSPQSSVVANKEWLKQTFQKNKKTLGNTPTRPKHWGGYLLAPSRIEFWQGRPSRMHDRLLFTLTGRSWKIERLAP